MAASEPLIELTGVSKDYRALRPLRIQQLQVRAGEAVALLGVDAAMSEVLVNLMTGAQLPDSGEVRIFGRPTSAVTAVDEWVADLDRFGLISGRAVLVEQFTAEQNLAMPLSLEIESLSAALRDEVHALALEVGLKPDELTAPTAALRPAAQLRLRLGRALALRPQVLLAEHPNSTLSGTELTGFATDLARITAARGLASLITTVDATFASALTERVLRFEPGTGLLRPASGRRRWFF
jgi:predicted ABC-type transport system involved in lysophospholipase L1 biosynthesis ATPase subunit